MDSTTRVPLLNVTVIPARCVCLWITHPCDGKPMLYEPVAGCPVVEHAEAWREWQDVLRTGS